MKHQAAKCSARELSRATTLLYTGLLKKKYTHSKIYFTETTDAKFMSCVRMERKSLRVLISMI
jgi:hypothetical protein